MIKRSITVATLTLVTAIIPVAGLSQTSIWAGGNGLWFSNNWIGGIPNGPGVTADIGNYSVPPITGTVTLNRPVNLGTGGVVLGSGAPGALQVTAAVNTLTADRIDVGFDGPGTSVLTIQNGGVVNTGLDAYLGTQSNATGMATVSDAGSLWNISRTSYIGDYGQGTLTISGGGQVNSSGGAIVGFQPGSAGVVNVSGAGSQWISNGLTVGGYGNGTLTINAGGQVTDAEGDIASGAGSVSSVTVSGSGSQWNQNFVIVRDNGTLTINSGGRVTGGAYIDAGGAVTVSGTGSQWNTNHTGNTANQSFGTLTINSGGSLTGYDLTVGNSAGTANVTVAGSGSQWNTVYMFVSGGTVTISSGGQVTTGFATTGYNGSTGHLPGAITVTGTGSQLTADSLYVGQGGSGTLSITNGGVVNDNSAAVAVGASSTGDVLVDAATWTTTGALTIGDGGTGCVTLQDQATLSAGSLTIGANGCLVVDPSVVNVAGNFTLMPGALLSVDIAGTTPDLLSQLNIGGLGVFDGTIDFDFINGFAPHAGDQFDLITALGGADFSLASFQILGLQPGFEYTDMFGGGHFTLTALNNGVSTTTVPEPGTLLLLGLALFTMMAVGMKRSRLASHPRRLRCSSYRCHASSQ